MLKVGEFSQLSQVTVKTLHYYDRLGLLTPVHIDPFTNYRYYSLEQLPRVHRIVALKELGLSLEEIGRMLDEELPAEQIRGMLRLKRAEAHQLMREAQRQLTMIEFHLRMIEAEAGFANLNVVIKRLEPLRCLSFFPAVSRSMAAARRQMKETAGALQNAIAGGAIRSTGVSIDKFFGEAILDESGIAFRKHEILHGVTGAQKDVTVEGIGRLQVKEEPAVETAVTLMLSSREHGHLDSLEKATLLRRWAASQGYKTAEYIRFYNYRGPLQTLEQDEFLFEAQLPVTATE